MKNKKTINLILLSGFLFFASDALALTLNDPLNIPQVSLPDISQNDFKSSFDVLENNIMTQPLSGFTRPYQMPGNDYGGGWWQLDQSLELGADKWVNKEFSENVIRNFIDQQVQNPDGHIDFFFLSENIGSNSSYSSMPAYFGAAYDIIKRSDDEVFMEDAYLSMKKYYDWFKNSKTDETTGLTSTYWEEGVYTIGNSLTSNQQIGVDLNVLLAHAALQISEIAGRLGHGDDSSYYQGEFLRRKTAINTHLWDDAVKKYRNLNIEGYTFVEYDDIGTYYPLIDNIADAEKRSYLIEAVTNDSLFGWNHNPLNTLAKTDPQFVIKSGAYSGEAWRGDIWTLTNYYIIKGLEDVGRNDLAAKLAYDTIKLVNGSYYEYYTQDGQPQGSANYGWTASQYSQLIIEDLFGISFDAMTNTITISPRIPKEYDDEAITIGNVLIPTTGDKIEVSISKLDGYARSVTVSKNDSVNQYNLILDIPVDYGNEGVVKLLHLPDNQEISQNFENFSFLKKDINGDAKKEAYRVTTTLGSSEISLKAIGTDPGFFEDTFGETPGIVSLLNAEISNGEAFLNQQTQEYATLIVSSEHSTMSYLASSIVDGSLGSIEGASGYWNDDTMGVFPDWVGLEFREPFHLNGVNLRMPQSATDYVINNAELQYYDGENWITLETLSLATDQNGPRDHNVAVNNIQVTKVRVFFNEGNLDGWSFLDEFEVSGYHDPLSYSGILKSSPIVPSELLDAWGEFSWNDTVVENSSLEYQVEYYNGTSWELVSESDLPGNQAGFSLSPVDLSHMDIDRYGKIRLVANFASVGFANKPSLQDWKVSWLVGGLADPNPAPDQGAYAFGNPKLKIDGKRQSFSKILKTNKVTLTDTNPAISNGIVLIKDDKGRTIGNANVDGNGYWKLKVKAKSFRIHYFNEIGTEVAVSKRYKLKVDSEKPEMKNFPITHAPVRRGNVLSWKAASDNGSIDYYTVKFVNRSYKVKRNQIRIPLAVKAGMQNVAITAYDKAGNKISKNMRVLVR